MSLESIPTNPKSLKALADRRHPRYAEKTDHWNFMYETYQGTREWFSKHIFKFNREGSETYRGRLDRAYRFNHTREVVDLVNKYLFKQPAQRAEDVPEGLKRFRQYATMSGLELWEFERQVGRYASIFGRVYVVVDNNYRGEAPLTVAEEKDLDTHLYAYIVQPNDFLDCGYDTLGQYSWVLLRENYRDDADPFEGTGDVSVRMRLWTRHYWAVFGVDSKGKVSLIEAAEHSLGVVPVIKCDHIESDEKYVVPALIEDVAYLDRAIANYLSNLDQIINDQTFSQLVMPAQGVLNGLPAANAKDPDDPDHEARRKEIVKLGTSQILLFDGEHGTGPSYIAPDPRQANLIITTIKQIINEIYHTVGLAGERTKQDNAVGIDNSSGVAKAFDFERVNALLSAKANSMQAFSNRLENLVRIYCGESISMAERGKDTVKYPMNFDVRNLIEELAISNELSLLTAPIELRREQMKSVLGKLWPMIPEKDKKKLEKAIDEWDDSLNNAVSANYSDGNTKTDPAIKPAKAGQGAVGGEKAVETVGK